MALLKLLLAHELKWSHMRMTVLYSSVTNTEHQQCLNDMFPLFCTWGVYARQLPYLPESNAPLISLTKKKKTLHVSVLTGNVISRNEKDVQTFWYFQLETSCYFNWASFTIALRQLLCLSNHILSSVPPTALKIPHFLNAFTAILGGIPSQASAIHPAISFTEAHFSLLLAVKVWQPLTVEYPNAVLRRLADA